MIGLRRAIPVVIAMAVYCGGASAAEMAASGIVLVAAPRLQDPNFRETVVLVTQPRKGGPFGVIINRPLAHKLGDVFTDHAGLKAREGVIHSGGPVAPQGVLFVLRATRSPPRATPVLRDVYLTADIDWIDERLREGEGIAALRVYAGHAGWAPGQLQDEIGRGDWYVVPADADMIFIRDPASLWPDLIKRAASRRTQAQAPERVQQSRAATADAVLRQGVYQ